MMSRRLQWIDIAKGMGIIFVFFGHIRFEPRIQLITYSFHIPLFFFLSGYVFSNKDRVKNFLMKKLKGIMIPYYVLGGILFVTIQLTHQITLYPQDVGKMNVFWQYVFQFRFGTLWYITVLFILNILLYMLLWISEDDKYLIICTIFIALVGSIYNYFVNIHLYFCLDIVPMAFPFFSIGYLTKKHNLFKKINNINIIAYFLLTVSAIFLAAVNVKLSNQRVDIDAGKYGNYVLFYTTALIFIFIIISLSMHVKSKLLEYIGRNSMLYYSLHQWIVFYIVLKIFSNYSIFQRGYTIGMLQIIVSLVVLTLLTKIIAKFKISWIFGVKYKS